MESKAFAKFKLAERTRLHLRELQSQKILGEACARNFLEKCAVCSPDGRYSAHIATVYYISRHPLSQNPPSVPGSIQLDSFILHDRRQKTVI